METEQAVVNCAECGEQQALAALFCEKCGEPLFVGKQAGVYKVVERIGEGGMGAVFKAEHVKLGTPFALKVLHKQFARKAELVARFVNEARATSRLRHEHIVFITDFGELEQFGPYIAMEFLEGETLKGALVPGDPLALDRFFTIAIQLAGTMAYAHGEGLIHRDLKPDNVFLLKRKHADSDFIKVLDFGIAKMFEGSEDASLTQTGAVLGTPIYMSPEQALSKELDYRADIYSFGTMLFEMLTGYIPFQGTSAFELIEKRLFQEAPNISMYAPQWAGSPLETLVGLCLMREPKDRLQSMAELKDKLEAIQERQNAPRASAPAAASKEAQAPKEASEAQQPLAQTGAMAPEAQQPLAQTGAMTPKGQLPTGTMFVSEDDLDDDEAFAVPAKKSRAFLLLALILCLCGGVTFAVFGPHRKPQKTVDPRLAQAQPPDDAGARQPAKRPLVAARRPLVARAGLTKSVVARSVAPPITRPRVRRRRRRVFSRRRVLRRAQPPQPQVRRSVPRAAVPQLGANGCPRRTARVNYIRMFANDNRVKVAVSRQIGRWGRRRIAHAKGGKGWCIRVPQDRVHVRVFGGHRELADCWFVLLYRHKSEFKISLRNLEDGGPGKYCQPR